VTKPKFNPGMIERYLLLYEYHNIKPILCLTKNDLLTIDPAEYQLFIDLGVEIFFITKHEDEELERFQEFITNKTVVFV
jgi:ribosome biogenesis GTPase